MFRSILNRLPLLMAAYFLTGGPVVKAAGPPLDMSGEWEAIPYQFVPATEGGGPYDRLSLRLTRVEKLPAGPGAQPYEFHYTGRYVQYETYRFTAESPPDCNPQSPLSQLNTYAVPFNVNFTSTWRVITASGDISVSSITGSGNLDLASLPSPHAQIPKKINFSWTSRFGGDTPTEDAYARFERRTDFYAPLEFFPADRCWYSTAGRDHGSFQMWKVRSSPAEVGLAGTIKGQVKSLNPVTTERSEYEVHRGQVFLYKQSEVLRAKRGDESDAEYAEYLAAHRTLARPAVVLTPEADGRFEFRDVPLLELRARGSVSTWHAIQYSVQVVSGETDELVLDDNNMVIPGQTEVLYFQPYEVRNLLPDSDELRIELRHYTGINAKLDLVADLIELGPENYGDIEGRVRTYLNNLAGNSAGLSPAQDEALRRAIWSERMVRDGSRYSEELLKAGLKAFAALMADALGDLKRWEAEGVADARKTFQQLRDPKNQNPRYSTQFNINEVENLPRNWQQMIQRGQRTEIADELIRLVKGFRLAMQEGLRYAGMEEARAKTTAAGMEQAFLIILNYTRNQTLRGAAKDAIKTALKEYLDDVLAPRLFDSSLPYSHTSIVAPDLEFSADRLMSWDRSDPEAYVADRAVVVERLSRLSNIANDYLRLAILLEASALVGDTTQKAAGVAAIVPPARLYAQAVEKFAKALKYFSNGSATAASSVFVFWGAPKLMREGVYGAWGEPVPAGLAGQSVASPDLAALAQQPPLVIPTTNQVVTAVRALTGLVSSNQIGAALSLAGSSETNGYRAAWDAWDDAVENLELYGASVEVTAASTVGGPLMRMQEAKGSLLLARAQYEASLQELLGYVLLDPTAATNETFYIAGQNRLAAQTHSVLTALSDFYETVRLYPSEWLRWQAAPALKIELLAPSSTNEIESMPQEIVIRARVTNLAYKEVSNVNARLTLVSSNENVAVSSELVQPIGTLQSAENSAGGHVAEVEWRLSYQDTLAPEPLAFQIDLLEGTEEPVTFVTLPRSGFVPLSAELWDADLDGLPDQFERMAGLDPEFDDAKGDADADGLTNAEEYRLGTRPDHHDTDGDGLSDREEIINGMDGVVTNARVADTDGDGISDSEDVNPVERYANTAPPAPVEPRASVDARVVTLSPANPIATVRVTNAANGLLQWSATSDDPSLVQPGVVLPDRSSGELLLLRLPDGKWNFQDFGSAMTTVRVHDVGGAEPDSVAIDVIVSGDFGAPMMLSRQAETGDLVLSWTGLAGRRYQVEYSADLVTWEKPADGLFTAPTDGAVLSWTDDSGPVTPTPPSQGGHRFYRVSPL
jgi:hypothetical protein